MDADGGGGGRGGAGAAVFALICGNLIRQIGEQCDNGNKIGCINCVT